MSDDASLYDEHESLKPTLGWVSFILLTLLYVGALVVYPPVTDASASVAMPDWAKAIGRFHVVALHLPVGVIMMAALMELCALVSRKHSRYLNPAMTFALHIAAWGSATSVVMGILLSRKGGFGSPLFQAHQWLGIAGSIGLLLTLFLKLLNDGHGQRRWLFRGAFALTLLVLSVGAHFGGNLVHGSDYLVKYTPPEVRDNVTKVEDAIIARFDFKPKKDDKAQLTASEAPVPTSAPVSPDSSTASTIAQVSAAPSDAAPSGTVYAVLIAPVLESKCNSCHNADKSKAGLRLDTHEFILKGGDNGAVLVAGDPEKSKMVSAIKLPKDDDDHMPPPKEKQPTAQEIELLSWWIKEGASKDLKVADAKIPDDLKSMVQTLATNVKGGSAGGPPPVLLALAEAPAAGEADVAVADAMRKINGSGASLAPVAADSKELRFTALNVAKDFKDAGLKDLEPIAERIVALDVAKTGVTDAGLASVAKMSNLRELHLENTAVTDAGIASLKGLSHLEYLNLYGSKVTDKALADVGGFAKLKALYAWQTGVTKAGVDDFKAKHPGVTVNVGWTEADNAKPVAAVAASVPEAKPASAPAPASTPAAAPAPAKPAPTVAVAATPAPTTAPVVASAAPEPAKPAAQAPATASTPATGGAIPAGPVYKEVIAPILAAKCTSCHGAEKSKGKLRLHTFTDIMKGGGDGATTAIAGKPGDSLMIKRANLPADDDDHMPPKDEKQLTKDEITLLTWWVELGASESLTLADAKKTPAVEAALKVFASTKPAAADVAKTDKPKAKPLTAEEKKAIAGVAAKMTALNASLMPLALDTEQLRFNCINAADKFGDKELEELAPIGTQVLWVDLSRSKVTDASCATLAKLTNLERLHLENTAITDAGLAQLGGLAHLEYLNLYGTKVTDAGIAKLAADKGLKKLFVWQTAVTKEGANKLQAAVPGLVVNVGLSETEIAKLVEQAKPPVPAKTMEKPAKAAKGEAKPAPATPAPAAKPAAAPTPAAPPAPAAGAPAATPAPK